MVSKVAPSKNILGTQPLADTLGKGNIVPVWRGVTTQINLDSAATTPPFTRTHELVSKTMEWYGSVHRGAGFSSVISTQLLERAKEKILQFSGARENDIAIFSHNATNSLNILARRFSNNFGAGFPIIVSEFEHSSNLLPWMNHGTIHVCKVDSNGDWDIDELEKLLIHTKARAIAITAASNITGRIIDVNSVSEVAHRHGALVVVDASQFVAHRSLRTERGRDSWDFVVFAGHKMYAPYGVGVLVGPRETFANGWPDSPGGGTVNLIDKEDIVWADLPSREEGGTPNYPGLLALAESCSILEDIGFDKIMLHEAALTNHAFNTLNNVQGINILRPLSESERWLPIFPFTVDNHHHGLVASYLGMEKGIAVRSGHLCQFEQIRQLTHVTKEGQKKVFNEVKDGDLSNLYGIVRASTGLTTTLSDLTMLTEALNEFLKTGTLANYFQDSDGTFKIENWFPRIPAHFQISW